MLYHACGVIDLVDKTGIDMLQLVASTDASVIDVDTQVDISIASDRFGHDTCIRGNVNTTILGSTYYAPERVIREIENILHASMAGGKRYMFAAGCEWPWEPVSIVTRKLGLAKAFVARDGSYKEELH